MISSWFAFARKSLEDVLRRLKEILRMSSGRRFDNVLIKDRPQLARNIPGIFAECSLSVAMFWASREHLQNMLKQNIF